MRVGGAVEVAPITSSDVEDVAAFLHAHLNSRLSPEQWAAAIVPPWRPTGPDHGYHLRADGHVVGAYIAFHSERQIDGTAEHVVNLGAWSVLEAYRAHGLRLLRSMLRQRDVHFTDLSPSGNVVPLNRRLKFKALDTTTALLPNVPRPGPRGAPPVRVSCEAARIEGTLTGQDLQVYRDHAGAAAARHTVITRGDDYCYVVWRHDRRKQLPLFCSLLHVSNPALLQAAWRPLSRHLLLRHRVPVTLAELRVAGSRPPGAHLLASSRPKMYRSDRLREDQVDYLYSELTCVAW